jgi:hypothetical protein
VFCVLSGRQPPNAPLNNTTSIRSFYSSVLPPPPPLPTKNIKGIIENIARRQLLATSWPPAARKSGIYLHDMLVGDGGLKVSTIAYQHLDIPAVLAGSGSPTNSELSSTSLIEGTSRGSSQTALDFEPNSDN